MLSVVDTTQLWSDPKIEALGEVAAYTPQGISRGEWQDATLNANHGTVTGATMVGVSVVGNSSGNRIVNSQTVQGLQDGACYNFDGVNDYAKVEGIDPTEFTKITVSAWVKIKAKSAWGTIAIQADSNAFNEGWGLQFIESTDNLIFWVDHYNDPAEANVSAHYGKWLHVVGTYDGTDQKLYFNGVVFAPSIIPIVPISGYRISSCQDLNM